MTGAGQVLEECSKPELQLFEAVKEPKLTAIIPIFGDPDRDRRYVQRTSGGVVSAWQRGSISRFHLRYGNHG